MERVVVIGGGNAGLCAAIESAERGSEVILIEASPEALRGGNSKYTRDIRYAHGEDRFTSGEYPRRELLEDLRKVSGSSFSSSLAEMVVERSELIPEWMHRHGVRFKREIRGTLDLNRTNAFFMGGGKFLVDTYYSYLSKLKVRVLYETQVVSVGIRGNRITHVGATVPGGSVNIEGDRFVFASGGFEANREWLSEFWGEASQLIKVRGSRYNTGLPLRALLDAGAIPAGLERSGHMVAVDARGPDYDGGIVTRIDAIPWGVAVNSSGERFYDEGEDIWPKRYAIWGRLVAEQKGCTAYVITDKKTVGRYMPTAYPPFTSHSLSEVSDAFGIDRDGLIGTLDRFNRGIVMEGNDPFMWHTTGVEPPKSHWAVPINTPPYMVFPVRPGLTFTYQGVAINSEAMILSQDGEIENGFAAGEIASGNVLSSGYLAGFGLTIGSVLGRIAGGWEGE